MRSFTREEVIFIEDQGLTPSDVYAYLFAVPASEGDNLDALCGTVIGIKRAVASHQDVAGLSTEQEADVLGEASSPVPTT